MTGRPLCVAIGLVSILLGILGLLRWWPLSVTLLKAAVPLILLMGGLIAVIAGASEFGDTDPPKDP